MFTHAPIMHKYGQKVFNSTQQYLYSNMNVQFTNVKEVLEVKVASGGRITGLKKYEGITVKVIVFGELMEDPIIQTYKGMTKSE